MELRQLEQFRTIVETGTMSQAAQQLHISQPALSVSVRKLEEEFGAALFQRIKNKISLTEAGEIVYRHACAMVMEKEQLISDVERLKQKQNRIVVGFDDPGPMWYLMPNMYMAYGTEKIKETLYDADVKDLFQQFDLVISTRPIQQESIHTIHLIDETLYLSVPSDSPYAQYDQIDLLRDTPDNIVRYALNRGEHHKQVEDFWHRLSEKTRIQTYTDYIMFQQMILNDESATITTKIVKEYRHDGNDRKLIPITTEGTKTTYYLSWKKENEQTLHEYIQYITYVFSMIQ